MKLALKNRKKMRVYYLEGAKSIRVSIGFRVALGSNDPQTQAKNKLLQANIDRLGIPIEPSVHGSITRSTSQSFFHSESTYFSSDLCYLFKLDNFSSIDDITNNLLYGFSYVSDYPQELQYCYDTVEDKQKLMAYFNDLLLLENNTDNSIQYRESDNDRSNEKSKNMKCSIL